MNNKLLTFPLIAMLMLFPLMSFGQNRPVAILDREAKTLTFTYSDKTADGKYGRSGVYDIPNYYYHAPAWIESSTGTNDYVDTVIFEESFNQTYVTQTQKWFYGFTKLKTIKGIENLNTSYSTDMHEMFANCSSLRSLDLSHLIIYNSTNIDKMVSGCSNLQYLKIGNYDLSKSANASNAFSGINNCYLETGVDFDLTSLGNIGVDGCYSWLGGKFTLERNWPAVLLTSDTVATFTYCDHTNDSIKTYQLGYYFDNNVTKVIIDQTLSAFRPTSTYMWFMPFRKNKRIEGLENLNTSEVIDMSYMFYRCESLRNLDLQSFNTSNVTDMSYMFSACVSLDTLNVSTFNTSKVKTMEYIFSYCSSLVNLNLRHFNTANVTNMEGMFEGCNKLNSLDLSSFNTANVTNMGNMFSSCSNLERLIINNFNTTNVTNMKYMFYQCGIPDLDLSNFNTRNVTNMGRMFGRWQLSAIDISHFDVSNVKDMSGMFANSKLRTIDIANFSPISVTDIWGMFEDCENLESLDISGFNVDSNTKMNNAFSRCKNLKSLNVGRCSSWQDGVFGSIGTVYRPCQLIITNDFDKSVLGTKYENYSDGYYLWCGGYFSEPIVDTTNGINRIIGNKIADKVNISTYNLSGQKVGKDYKGVVIANGKKMIRK